MKDHKVGWLLFGHISFHINVNNQLLPNSFLWRSPCHHKGGHSSLVLPLSFLETMWREDVTPLSLTIRVALTKLSKEALKGLAHLPSKKCLCPGLGQLGGSSTPGRCSWHAPKYSLNSSQDRLFPYPFLARANQVSRRAATGSCGHPGSQQASPPICTICPPHSSETAPNLVSFTYLFLKGPPLGTHRAFFGLTGC